jgi:hypothetical protein
MLHRFKIQVIVTIKPRRASFKSFKNHMHFTLISDETGNAFNCCAEI